MTIGSVLLELLKQIEDAEYTDEVKAILKDQIQSATVNLTLNPRNETEGNLKLLNAAMCVILGTAESLYGVRDYTVFKPYRFPLFKDQPQSQIIPLKKDLSTVAMVLGTCVESWEDVFYDICHESLHLLNPVLGVKINEVKVSTLEEGVAVKFAEQMYEKHIKKYCNKTPVTSPVNSPNSQYFKAYTATKKIPDEVLKKIRKEFGMFSKIDDANKFRELVSDYLNEREIEILLTPFKYH